MEKKRRLPVLTVMQIGNPEFERFVIEDQKGRVWTGERLSAEERGALYHHSNDACIDMQNVLKSHFKGVEPQRYLVPLFVEVYSDQPVHVAEVVKHLSRATRLSLNVPKHGHGPGESLIVPWIEWHRIETLKELPND